MEKGIITWLHLSDRHFSLDSAQIPSEKIQEFLLRDLQKRKDFDEDLENIDYFFFTGDLVYSGKKQEFESAFKSFLLPLINLLKIKNENVFIVPGNHEINRDKINEKRNEIRTKISERKLSLKEIEEIIGDKHQKEILLEPFNDYIDFINKNYPHLNLDKQSHGGFHIIRNKNNFVVEITGINTAWLGYGGSKDKERLSIGLPFLKKYQNSTDNSKNLRILLMHHPFDWLKGCQKEFDNIPKFIRFKYDVILQGHLHERNYYPFYFEKAIVQDSIEIVVPTGAIFSNDELERFYYYLAVYDIKTSVLKLYGRMYEIGKTDFINHTADFPFIVECKQEDFDFKESTFDEVKIKDPNKVLPILKEVEILKYNDYVKNNLPKIEKNIKKKKDYINIANNKLKSILILNCDFIKTEYDSQSILNNFSLASLEKVIEMNTEELQEKIINSYNLIKDLALDDEYKKIAFRILLERSLVKVTFDKKSKKIVTLSEDEREETLLEYVDKLNPNTDAKTAIIVARWHELKENKIGVPINTIDLAEGFSREKPANLADVFYQCKQKKWMVEKGKKDGLKAFILTGTGLEEFNKMV